MTFELNGKTVSVDRCKTHTTLLEFIRLQGLTGAKEGCAEGECGACTVLFVRPHGTASKLVPVNSCLVLLPMAIGHEVFTVEALASEGKLAEVQQAMVEKGGSQCGYCTPGFIVSMFAEQYRPDRAGPCDPHQLGGNLCRCTGYRPIRDALALVGAPSDQRFQARMAQGAPVPGFVNSEGFSRPTSLQECFQVTRPESRWIAGATDLGVESNLHGRRFEHLVSVEAVPELQVFDDGRDEIVIGAGLPLSEIGLRWPYCRDWLALFASPLIRNRATLGGNLGTASPIGDSAPFLMSLDARVKIASAAGERMVPLASFFKAYRRTEMEPGELLVSVHIPKPLPEIGRFYKVAKRRMDDISTVAAGFAIQRDAAGAVRSARLAFGGVAAVPVRATAAEEELLGGPLTRSTIDRAKKVIGKTLQPISDHRGSAAYRLAMAQSLLDKFLWEVGA